MTVILRYIIGINQDQIEHTSLPSGLHNLKQDFILFTHPSPSAIGTDRPSTETSAETDRNADREEDEVKEERLAGCALFRSRDVVGGRGRQMGSLGVILGELCDLYTGIDSSSQISTSTL